MLILSFNKCLLGPTVPASLDTTFNLPLKEALSPPRYRRESQAQRSGVGSPWSHSKETLELCLSSRLHARPILHRMAPRLGLAHSRFPPRAPHLPATPQGLAFLQRTEHTTHE